MQIPTFPECDHELVKALIHYSDYALVKGLQRSPADGRYFTTLFCRYSSVVYSLIRHSAKSPVQADYLFALTWRHILSELGAIDLSPYERSAEKTVAKSAGSEEIAADETETTTSFSLQGWLINLTAAHINQVELPNVESIHYVLSDAPPPLWCYTERALDRLPPRHRLMMIMSRTFGWSDTRISAYLQAEGENLSAQEVHSELQIACQSLERLIPADMRAIYLAQALTVVPTPAEAGLMTIEFDEPA
ncbi:MAG: sigma-70 family RNA polymerase sigma factor [Cyanobacteria bacterium P01_D01_bin.1]